MRLNRCREWFRLEVEEKLKSRLPMFKDLTTIRLLYLYSRSDGLVEIPKDWRAAAPFSKDKETQKIVASALQDGKTDEEQQGSGKASKDEKKDKKDKKDKDKKERKDSKSSSGPVASSSSSSPPQEKASTGPIPTTNAIPAPVRTANSNPALPVDRSHLGVASATSSTSSSLSSSPNPQSASAPNGTSSTSAPASPMMAAAASAAPPPPLAIPVAAPPPPLRLSSVGSSSENVGTYFVTSPSTPGTPLSASSSNQNLGNVVSSSTSPDAVSGPPPLAGSTSDHAVDTDEATWTEFAFDEDVEWGAQASDGAESFSASEGGGQMEPFESTDDLSANGAFFQPSQHYRDSTRDSVASIQAPPPSFVPSPDEPGVCDVILHFHGGGFVSGSPNSHEIYLRSWANTTGAIVFSVDYSLSPETKFPVSFNECFYCYYWLICGENSLGIKPRKILLAGDSAGANLVLAIALKAIEMGLRVPDGLYIAYPAIDFSTGATPSRLVFANDIVAPYYFMEVCLQSYAPSRAQARSDWVISPLNAPDNLLSQLPDDIVVNGAGFDGLLDDSIRFIKRLDHLDKPYIFELYEVPHAFFNYVSLVDEAERAMHRSGNMLRCMLDPEFAKAWQVMEYKRKLKEAATPAIDAVLRPYADNVPRTFAPLTQEEINAILQDPKALKKAFKSSAKPEPSTAAAGNASNAKLNRGSSGKFPPQGTS